MSETPSSASSSASSLPNSSARPAIFEAPIHIEESDIDGLGHVNNVVYLRWVQDVASAHWFAASTLEQRATYGWVAIRHEIDYLHAAYLGDTLVARTQVGMVSGVRFERFVEIIKMPENRVIAATRSMWVAVDATTKRPRRIDPAINRQFYETISDPVE